MESGGNSLATSTDADNGRNLTPGLRVIVVLGATATGKTDLALRLAESTSGEIVNADSRYFYRGMDIGTAKPSAEERERVLHHLIDILEPVEQFSLGAFLDQAYAAIECVARRGHVPIVTGGTPQYLRGLIEGWRPPPVAPDESLRARLDREATDVLFARLGEVDPRSAERIGPDNRRRMIRALEVYEILGRPMSEVSASSPPPWRFLLLGLRRDRDVLYERIDSRVREMHEAGWLDEVRRLVDSGVTAATPSMSAHGYREALAVLDGSLSLGEAIRQTQVMVHSYVRHQETWFRRFEGINWLDSSDPEHVAQAQEIVRQFLAE